MLDGFFGRKKRDEDFLLKMMKAAAEGESLAPLHQATATISDEPLRGDDTEKAGTAAAILATSLANSAISGIQDDDDRFTAGMFAFIAADHFSRVTAGSFELAAVLSVMRTLGSGQFERCFTAIESSHRRMLDSKSNVAPAIGQNCATWLRRPSPENFEKLVRLFKVVRESSTGAS
jgi:hypothetical protein